MFLKNNDSIPFAKLQQRVAFEVGRIARLVESAPRDALDQAKQKAPVAPAPRRPPLLRLLFSWVWCILHIRRVREWAEQAHHAWAVVEEQLRATNSRLDSIDGQVHRVAERLREGEVRAGDLTHAVAELKREIMFQQRRLTRLLIPSTVIESGVATATTNGRLDSLYVALEDTLRGDREDIKGRLHPYVERIMTAGAGQADKPVLDIGCGRGEWLELLRQHGIAAYGIDSNSMMVERATSLGLDARRSDLLEHLHGLTDMSRGGITAFHVVEHLPFALLVDFLDEALRVLIPSGILILETPNPETVRVGATTFYNDPTHLHPLPPMLLELIVGHRGFEEVEVIKRHPFTQGLLQARGADAELLNRVLFGPQDYAIIARRG